ncbi:MAG: hypothetical protein WBP64_04900 [Nitrososphaeraceae archaeon]
MKYGWGRQLANRSGWHLAYSRMEICEPELDSIDEHYIPISYFPVGTGDFLNENPVLAKILKISSPILVFVLLQDVLNPYFAEPGSFVQTRQKI